MTGDDMDGLPAIYDRYRRSSAEGPHPAAPVRGRGYGRPVMQALPRILKVAGFPVRCA